jgi:antitoxin VapB
MIYIMIYIRGDAMAQLEKAKVFMSGRSQAVRIPAEYRFTSNEVYIRRDPRNGDLILSQAPGSLREIFAAFDRLGVPQDFLSPEERAQDVPQERDEDFLKLPKRSN